MSLEVPNPTNEVHVVIARISRFHAVSQLRRNHALEHAAISVVTEHHPTVFLSGRSNSRGFYVFGRIDTSELRASIDEALQRLTRGEAQLAIHPRCGTNLAVSGILAGLAASSMSWVKPRQNRLAASILASIGALMVAPRFGSSVQRNVTTLADMTGVRVARIERRRLPFVRDQVHWVQTVWTN